MGKGGAKIRIHSGPSHRPHDPPPFRLRKSRCLEPVSELNESNVEAHALLRNLREELAYCRAFSAALARARPERGGADPTRTAGIQVDVNVLGGALLSSGLRSKAGLG